MSSTAGKVISCKAAVAWELNKPLSIETIEVAPPKADEVRVKIIATGICHTDASFLTGGIPLAKLPVILGHEGAGIVESVGEGVTKFKPGDHVIPLSVSQCFKCKTCKDPKTNQCLKLDATQSMGVMIDGTSRFTCKGKTVNHNMGTSTFSEYTVVNESSLSKINEKAPLNKVCLIGCGITTGYGAAVKSAQVERGSICGVWGLGGVGLAVVMGCRIAGASKIYGIDINPEKAELAKKFGLTDFVNPNDYDGKNFVNVLMQMTGGGFDYTFECAGTIHTTKAAFEASNKNSGITVVVGVPSLDKGVTIMPFDLVCGRTLKGSYGGGWKTVETVPKIVDEYMDKKIFVDELISHVLKLDDINTGFDLMKAGKSTRSVVEM